MKGKKKYKTWYYVQTAIGYGIYKSFAELENGIKVLTEKNFQIEMIFTIKDEI